MRKTYLPLQSRPEDRFPNLRLLNDAELGAALHGLYFLLEAEDANGFYLVFDYRPTLPTMQDELAALPRDVLDTIVAVLEFDDEAERVREVEAIRCSLRDDGDDGAGMGARLHPPPPALTTSAARQFKLTEEVGG